MMPQNVLSDIPIPDPFLAPRTNIRFSAQAGRADTHLGGVALGDPSLGIVYQLWELVADNAGNLLLSAPNTPQFTLIPNVGAVWCALAFDQNARVFAAWADKFGNASYYWFDSTLPGYRISGLPGTIVRVFAALDDNRPPESSLADILLVYERAGELYFRQQRDRYGVEYDLGAAPATLVQVGMNTKFRFQFAFQNVQGDRVLPPSEFLGAN